VFSTVEQYAALGDHRTGTPVDAATIAWFTERCRAAGAVTTIEEWDFDRYDVDWEVTLDGSPVDSIPLYYEGVGRAQTDMPFCTDIEVMSPDNASELAAIVALARSAGSPVAVMGTRSRTGRLFAFNREAVLGSGLLVLCVPPDLPAGRVTARIEASIVPGSSANVIARFGTISADGVLVVGTPLSGWFRCAGERGTGIAVAIEACRRVAATRPVILVGTSGHELQGLGHRRLQLDGTPSAVVHIGASAAAHGTTPGVLSEGVAIAVGGSAAAADALTGLGRPVQVPDDAHRGDPLWWRGEAQEWSRLGVPLISIAGYSHLFHSPADLPDAATTPALLASVADALTEAALALP
jgi:hypothetical protein